MNSAWLAVAGSLVGVALGGLIAYLLDLAHWRHEQGVRWLDQKRRIYARFLQVSDEYQSYYDFLFDALARERRGEEVGGDPAEAIDRFLRSAGEYGGLVRELSLLAGQRVREAGARAGEALIELTTERAARALDPTTADDPLTHSSKALDRMEP